MNPASEFIALGAGTKEILTPWLDSAADNAFFSYELVHSYFESGGGVTVTVSTKNRADAGSEGTSYTTFTQLGSTGIYHRQCTDLKELVRFKVAITAATTTPSRTEGAILRFLPPTWYFTAS